MGFWGYVIVIGATIIVLSIIFVAFNYYQAMRHWKGLNKFWTGECPYCRARLIGIAADNDRCICPDCKGVVNINSGYFRGEP